MANDCANRGSFTKGDKPGRRSRGRPKGSKAKSTSAAREAVAKFVDLNVDKFQVWLEEIHDRDGPKEAFKCVEALLEYHIPKLARTEMTGKDEGPIELVVSWADE